MDQLAHNAATIREFTRTFKNQHDVDGIDHLFTSTFRHNFAGPLRPGLDGLKDVGRMMNHAFPDLQAFVSFPPLVITPNEVGTSTIQAEFHRV